jgi:ABC-2 type transport system permease protein
LSLGSVSRWYGAVQATNARAVLALRGAFWAQVVGMALNNLVFFATWLLFFHRFEEIRGWRLPDMAALYGLVATAFGLGAVFAGGATRLAAHVLEGRLDVALVQPKPPLLHLVGARMRASGAGDVASGLFLLAASGLVTLETLPVVVVGVLAAAVVLVSTAVVAHSAVFFLGPIEALARQFVEFLVTFSVYPDAIATGLLRGILFTALPAAFVSWLPVGVLREFSWGGLALVVGGAVAYAGVAAAVFRAGLRRYESGGGFGGTL